MKRVLAIDLGGTKTAVGIVDNRGTILSKKSAPTPRGDPDAVLSLALKLAADAGYSSGTVEALGLALPGVVDEAGETLVRSPSSGWTGVPFKRLFSEAFNLPVIADNDVNACALAEAVYGSGKGFDPFFWMTVSTGVGGAVFCGGKVLQGAHGMAGEIGHLVVRPGGAACNCGNRGCLEAEAAGPAWTRKAAASPVDSRIRHPELDAKAVAEMARAGDPACLRVVDDVADALAAGIGSVIALIDPRAVFIGGGVAGAADMLIPRIEALLPNRVLAWNSRTIKILPSGLGYDAALIGAAALAFGQKHER